MEINSTTKFARKVFYGPLVGVISPFVGTALVYYAPCSHNVRQIGYFQICAKLVGVIPAAIMKPYFKRLRPAAWILIDDGDDDGNDWNNSNEKKHFKKLREKNITSYFRNYFPWTRFNLCHRVTQLVPWHACIR